MGDRVCFLGATRYRQPLGTTSAKKFRALSALAEIFVIGFSRDWHPRRFTEDARFYLLPYLPIPILRYLVFFPGGLMLALWCILRHDARILVCQSPYEGFSAGWAKILAKTVGKRVVLVVENHGNFETSLFMQRRVLVPNLYQLIMRRMARFSIDHADLLRSISSMTDRQLEEWGPGKPRIKFPTWTDIEAFLQVKQVDHEVLGQNVLYVGRIIPGKGIHYLVEAFSLIADDFPQARLTLVGHAENVAYSEELKAQLKRIGLQRRVQFIDQLPQMELASLMQEARVVVLPAVAEGLGRVVFEAMATGTPVIGSQVDGIPDMISDGVTGFLVPPGDVVLLAERLRWVLTHPNKVQEMGRKARAFAKEFFSTEKYLRGYEHLFDAAEEIVV